MNLVQDLMISIHEAGGKDSVEFEIEVQRRTIFADQKHIPSEKTSKKIIGVEQSFLDGTSKHRIDGVRIGKRLYSISSGVDEFRKGLNDDRFPWEPIGAINLVTSPPKPVKYLVLKVIKRK